MRPQQELTGRWESRYYLFFSRFIPATAPISFIHGSRYLGSSISPSIIPCRASEWLDHGTRSHQCHGLGLT